MAARRVFEGKMGVVERPLRKRQVHGRHGAWRANRYENNRGLPPYHPTTLPYLTEDKLRVVTPIISQLSP